MVSELMDCQSPVERVRSTRGAIVGRSCGGATGKAVDEEDDRGWVGPWGKELKEMRWRYALKGVVGWYAENGEKDL
jgi:hypothetical protein